MGELNCPNCKREVATLRIQYECPNGHVWGEAVDRAVTDPPAVDTQSERKGLRMPFGKYKGQFVEDLPKDYVDWLLNKWEGAESLREELREELQNQLDMKSGRGVIREEVKRDGLKFTFGGKK